MTENAIFNSVLFAIVCLVPIFIKKPGNLNVVSPRFVFPVLFFLTYGLEPLLSAFSISSFNVHFLRFDFRAQEYLTVFMLFYWFGFLSLRYARATLKPKTPASTEVDYSVIESISPNLLVAVAVVAFVIYVAVSGGTSSLISSTTLRGEGQWDWTAESYIRLAIGLLAPIICVVAGLVLAVSPPHQNRRLWLVPILFAVPRIATFSRAGLLYPFLFVLAAYLANQKRFGRKTIVSFAIMLLVGVVVALQARSYSSNTGLAGYLRVIEGYGESDSSTVSYRTFDILVNGVSRFDAVALVMARTPQDTSVAMGFAQWIRILLPVPTVFGWYDRNALNLATAGGLHGNPFPSVGDMYYFVRYGAVAIAFIMGVIFAWLETKISDPAQDGHKPRWEYIILYISVIQGILISFNNTSRAASRYAIYAVITVLALKFLHQLGQKLGSKYGISSRRTFRKTANVPE